MKRLLLILPFVTACAPIHFSGSGPAAEEYAKLHNYKQQMVADQFYDLGRGDEIRRLYFAQLESHESRTNQASVTGEVRRRYVEIPVQENIQSDGTIKEAHREVVEVNQ